MHIVLGKAELHRLPFFAKSGKQDREPNVLKEVQSEMPSPSLSRVL